MQSLFGIFQRRGTKNMRVKALLTAGTLLTTAALFGTLSSGANAAAVCPATRAGTPLSTTPGACNLLVTFNADGSVTTGADPLNTTGAQNYDGSEDAVVGVINNSGHSISSFSITGTGIFGFDGDGIDTLTVATITNAAAGLSVGLGGGVDAYGGADAFYTGVVGNTGTVNFLTPIPTGGTDFFSLEESINVAAPPVINAAPEPASLAVLGIGLLGLRMARRRKR
jgi:hypothetical protein